MTFPPPTPLPLPEEERDYIIGPGSKNPILIKIKGIPPCLYCGDPVTSPSMDGPLVCPPCDMGVNKDGSRWTAAEFNARREQFRRNVEKYRSEAPVMCSRGSA